MSRHELHIGAKAPRFMHQRASFDPACLRRVAGRNGTRGLRHRRDDNDRLAPKLGMFLLLARSEKTVEIENKPAQHSSPQELEDAYWVSKSRGLFLASP